VKGGSRFFIQRLQIFFLNFLHKNRVIAVNIFFPDVYCIYAVIASNLDADCSFWAEISVWIPRDKL